LLKPQSIERQRGQSAGISKGLTTCTSRLKSLYTAPRNAAKWPLMRVSWTSSGHSGPFGDHGLDLGIVDVAAPALAVVVQVGVEDGVGIRQRLDPLLKPWLVEDRCHGLGTEAALVEQPGLNLLPDAFGIALALLVTVEGVDRAALEDLAALLVRLELDPVAVSQPQLLRDLRALVMPDDGLDPPHRQIRLDLLRPQQLADEVPGVGRRPDRGVLRCVAVRMQTQGEAAQVEADVGLALAGPVPAEQPAVFRRAPVERRRRRPGAVQQNLLARVANLVIRDCRDHGYSESVVSLARTPHRSGRSRHR